MERITADIDTKNRLFLLYSVFRGIGNIKKIQSIEIKPSVSKGYHLTFWTNQNYSLKDTFALRQIINDDKHRINMDKKRKFGRQTFFYQKIKAK